ncbi:MAG: hypothetical protein AAGC79_09245 [Pseudomonadota bacterium]
MIHASEIQFLIGVAALCVFVILLCIEGNQRLKALFQELTLVLGWTGAGRAPWRAFTLRQLREARLFYYGLPADPRIPNEARVIARKFRRLSLVHMLVGWGCWYLLLALGAMKYMPQQVEVALYALPPIAALAMRLTILPWPRGDVWDGEAPGA